MAMLPFASSTRSKRRAKRPVEVRIALPTWIWLPMERQPESPASFFAALPSLRITALLILATTGVSIAATLCARGNYRGAVLSATAALGAGILFAGPISVQTVLLTWFATAPLASFYFRFPVDRSILTYNRLIFALVVV